MAVTVDPTSTRNTHHIKLTDADSTEVGFITTDAIGEKKPQVSVSPYPTMASQLRQGRGKYADRVPPFEDISISDFSGGLGALHFDEDSTKYFDGGRIDTSRAGEVLLGPLETHTTGLRDFDENWPGNVTSWQALYKDGTESFSTTFTAGASYTANTVYLIIRLVNPTPTSGSDLAGTITISIEETGGGTAKTATQTILAGIDRKSTSQVVRFGLTSAKSLTASTQYDLTVSYNDATSSATSYVSVACDSSGDAFYRVLDNTEQSSFDLVYVAGFFEYKNALYCIVNDYSNFNSKLYIAGYRGACDTNLADQTKLNDSSASGDWTADQWIGDTVWVFSNVYQPERPIYRTITDNDTTSLTVDSAFTYDHTNESIYVIMSDTWTEWQTLDAPVLDWFVVGDHVFFMFGNTDANTGYAIDRYREDNISGTWTKTYEVDASGISAAGLPGQVGIGIPRRGSSHDNAVAADLFFGRQDVNGKTVLDARQISQYDQDSFCVVGELLPNDRAWIDTTYANTTVTTEDLGCHIKIAAGHGATNAAHWKLDSPVDLSVGNALVITSRLTETSAYLDAGDLRIIIADADGNEDELQLDYDNTLTNTQILELPDPEDANTDLTAITDVYFHVNQDDGACEINIYGPILIIDHWARERYEGFEIGEKPNNMIAYAGGAGEVAEHPWLFTDRGVYYLEQGRLKKLYLKELEELQHPDNGRAACVNDVYLYFNLGETIQRYYAGHLDSIGPDTESYGLPANRRGVPTAMASYPGRVFVAIDAAETSKKHSSVIYRRNHGWHEFYRAPMNSRIRDIRVVARADTSDRLYVAQGLDVVWLPIASNPEKDTDYEYVWEGYIETPRIYGGLRETEKYYHALTLVTEYLNGSGAAVNIREIEVEYRTSEDAAGVNSYGELVIDYTPLSTAFDTSPRERIDLSSDNDTAARWIQFRFRINTANRTRTPILVSAILDSLERLDSSNTYTYNIRLKEGYDHNLLGQKETQTGKEKWEQIQTWVDDPKPLTLESTSAFEDGKLVFIEPERCRVLYSKVDDKGQEVRIYQLTLIEVD